MRGIGGDGSRDSQRISFVLIMSRDARKRSKTLIFHVIIRGANRQEIFHDDHGRPADSQRCKKPGKLKLAYLVFIVSMVN